METVTETNLSQVRLPRREPSRLECLYFSTKGALTQQLWGKRFGKGLTVFQREELDRRIAEWRSALPKSSQDDLERGLDEWEKQKEGSKE